MNRKNISFKNLFNRKTAVLPIFILAAAICAAVMVLAPRHELIQFEDNTHPYETGREFLESPDGIDFQRVADKAVEAFLAGSYEKLSEFLANPNEAEGSIIFPVIEYHIDLIYGPPVVELTDIKSEKDVGVAYDYYVREDGTKGTIKLYLIKIGDDWKVRSIRHES